MKTPGIKILMRIFGVESPDVTKKARISDASLMLVIAGNKHRRVKEETEEKIQKAVDTALHDAGCPMFHEEIWGADPLSVLRELAIAGRPPQKNAA